MSELSGLSLFLIFGTGIAKTSCNVIEGQSGRSFSYECSTAQDVRIISFFGAWIVMGCHYGVEGTVGLGESRVGGYGEVWDDLGAFLLRQVCRPLKSCLS